MTLRSLSHLARAAIATAALATAMSLTALTGSAAALTLIDTGLKLQYEPVLQPIVTPCSQIASFSPASARPGQDVDIYIQPPSSRLYIGYTVTGVQFANGVPATFTNVATHHVRAKVPVGSSAGPVRVTCRSLLTGGTWSIASATAFTPISFGNALNPSATTLHVGNSRTVTATLSHPAPEPITLTLAPQSNALSVQGLARGASGTVTIPTGQQSASFDVTAHAAAPGGAGVVVSGPNVVSSTLTVTVPTPAFNLSVSDTDADVHWGDSASYSVQLSSQNGFAGTVTLSASGLPFGASATPVSVNVPAGGSANATFTVATNQAATDLGPDSFTLRGESPNASDRTRTLDLRVLPDEAAFVGLTWRTASSTCDQFSATLTGTNVSIDDGPGGFTPKSHPHLRHAWTPGCRGIVVMGTNTGTMNDPEYPVSIFNVGFDNAIADAPGSRYNLGTAAWNHNRFLASADGSYLIGADEVPDNSTTNPGILFNTNLYNMLDLSHPAWGLHRYTPAESLSASIVGDEIQARPSGNSNDWDWTLP